MNAGDTPRRAGTPAPHPSPVGRIEPRYDIDRVLALVDEVIGLKAELAAQQYRHDLALWAMAERAAELEARTAHAEKYVNDMKMSRSWRLGQTLLRPAEALRRLGRPSGRTGE
jgi:hypothetical protein